MGFQLFFFLFSFFYFRLKLSMISPCTLAQETFRLFCLATLTADGKMESLWGQIEVLTSQSKIVMNNCDLIQFHSYIFLGEDKITAIFQIFSTESTFCDHWHLKLVPVSCKEQPFLSVCKGVIYSSRTLCTWHSPFWLTNSLSCLCIYSAVPHLIMLIFLFVFLLR